MPDQPAASDVTPDAAGRDIDSGDVTPGATSNLPRVLIDGADNVWVRDWQEGVDLYWDSSAPPSDCPSPPWSYAEIEARYGISTWLTSQKSTPS